MMERTQVRAKGHASPLLRPDAHPFVAAARAGRDRGEPGGVGRWARQG